MAHKQSEQSPFMAYWMAEACRQAVKSSADGNSHHPKTVAQFKREQAKAIAECPAYAAILKLVEWHKHPCNYLTDVTTHDRHYLMSEPRDNRPFIVVLNDNGSHIVTTGLVEKEQGYIDCIGRNYPHAFWYVWTGEKMDSTSPTYAAGDLARAVKAFNEKASKVAA